MVKVGFRVGCHRNRDRLRRLEHRYTLEVHCLS